MGLICGFGIWFDGMSGGVCLLNHSTQACRLTLTTGLASWLIALIGIMATFRETSLEGNWASRVLFVDMVSIPVSQSTFNHDLFVSQAGCCFETNTPATLHLKILVAS
jgi:hypothetical protein